MRFLLIAIIIFLSFFSIWQIQTTGSSQPNSSNAAVQVSKTNKSEGKILRTNSSKIRHIKKKQTSDSGNDLRQENQTKISTPVDDSFLNETARKNRSIINEKVGENYIDSILSNGKLVRWNPSTFPLTVYIENNPNLPPYYYQQIRKAFEHWQKASGNFITFKYTLEKNKAETYFVKTAPFEFDFVSLDKAELGQVSSGIFKVGLRCKFYLSVANLSLFMSALLSEYSYLKSNEAEKLLRMFSSEYVVSILNKYNFALFEFVNLNEAIENTLKGELGQKFEKIGLKLLDIKDIRYDLPRKSQKDYENNLKKKNENQNITTDENLPEENQQTTDEQYTPFGNIVIEKTE